MEIALFYLMNFRFKEDLFHIEEVNGYEGNECLASS